LQLPPQALFYSPNQKKYNVLRAASVPLKEERTESLTFLEVSQPHGDKSDTVGGGRRRAGSRAQGHIASDPVSWAGRGSIQTKILPKECFKRRRCENLAYDLCLLGISFRKEEEERETCSSEGLEIVTALCSMNDQVTGARWA
jgi:hypothetical protein